MWSCVNAWFFSAFPVYLLKAITSRDADKASAEASEGSAADSNKKSSDKHSNSAMELLKEKEKKDFYETDDTYEISEDL